MADDITIRVGLLSANTPSHGNDPAGATAIAAFMVADAMLAERAKGSGHDR